MRVMTVDSYATHEAFVKDLDSRYQEKEVPEACIKKLYPDVIWTDGMSMLWIGKQ